jgi:ferric-dicitrate binding protein FerR (iron transport regulator)
MMDKYVDKIIRLYTEYEPGEPARSTFHQWLSGRDLARDKEAALHRVWKNTGGAATEDTLASLASLQIRHQALTGRKNAILPLFRYAAAIALLVCLSSIFLFKTKTAPELSFTEYSSRSRQAEQLILPDGSSVLLNSGSVILCPDTYGKTARTVYLAGEASFKVCRNKDLPFVVKSRKFSITALGTEFDVSSRPGDACFKATLISGSIEIRQDDRPARHVLNPNEQFVYSDITKRYTVAQVDPHDAIARQQGDLVFSGATLAEVLDALERRHDVSFLYRPEIFNSDRYSFHFRKHSSISCIMDIIMEVAGDFACEKTGDSYRIFRKGRKDI